MVDLTGAYGTLFPVISQNTAAVLKHKAKFFFATQSVSIPLVKGTRFVILALLTEGTFINIGFGPLAGIITDERFSYSQSAGPVDLSHFFEAAPFTQYKEPDSGNVYLNINGQANKKVVVAVAAIKA